MSLFDRWLRKSPPPATQSHPEAEGETRREEPTGSPPPPTPVPRVTTTIESVKVPPGHSLVPVPAPQEVAPSMHFLKGGICIVSLGQGSDEPAEEVEALLRKHEPWLKDPRRISLVSREETISSLFGPSPSASVLPRFVLWVFSKRALCALLLEPASLQALLRHFYRLGTSAQQPLIQCAFFESDCGPLGTVMARLLIGLGMRNVRMLHPDDPQRLLAVEVHRPDGNGIASLRGYAIPPEAVVDDFLHRVNKEKDRAEAQGDAPRLRELEQQERDFLLRELQPIEPQLHQHPLLRAPRLCRLLRTAADRASPTARQEVERELLGRKLPLLLLMNPDDQTTPVATFHGIGSAFRAYPDHASLTLTVQQLEMTPGSYGISGMAARDVFNMVATTNHSLALNVYLTPYTPTYVFWLPDEVRLLARGQLTSRA